MFDAAKVFADEGMFSGLASGRWRLLPTRANASPAFAIYQRDEKNKYQAFGIHVLEFDVDELSQIISFIDPSLPIRFGLPSALSAS
jgi:RNA polymerase sigma-70 factor (ECF subfamily)